MPRLIRLVCILPWEIWRYRGRNYGITDQPVLLPMHESRRPRRKPTASHARGRKLMKGPPRNQYVTSFCGIQWTYVRVVGLTELQSTAQDNRGIYIRENLEKGYMYLIILDLHLCPCTFVIVRVDSSEFKTPEMKEARLLEKSQERCQWTGYRLLVNPWPQTRPAHLRGNNGNRHILFDPTEFPRSERLYVW